MHSNVRCRLRIGNWIRLSILLLALFHGKQSSLARSLDHQLWGALIVANNKVSSEPVAAELVPYQKQLRKVFGYPHFQILGKSIHRFSDNSEQWLIPGETFSLRSFVTPTEDNNFHLALQLFQAKKELVQTEAKLGPGSPLFIRGPLYGDGQLIIVIMVRQAD